MTVAILQLDWDRKRVRLEEFRLCARRVADRLRVPEEAIHPCVEGADLIEAANGYGPGEVDQLVLLGHGTTTAFLLPGKAGIDARPARWTRKGIVSPESFTAAWKPKMASSGLTSIAACLCSRSPHWFLRQVYGQLVSPWGPVSYGNGGAKSMTGVLRDAFVDHGLTGWVFRGHCAAGHCLYQALLREHRCVKGQDGWSLFKLALGSVEPTLASRRKWQRVVKGDLASEWLLGLDSMAVVEEIRRRWNVAS